MAKNALPPKLTDWKQFIKSGDRIFVASNAACPHALTEDLVKHAGEFRDLEMVHILILGPHPWTEAKYGRSFNVNSLFLGPGTRKAVAAGVADYTPCFLSEIPSLFVDGVLPIDVALIQVSPPDQYGYCSLGPSVDIVSSAWKSARHVIAQINSLVPRTFGQSFIHVSAIHACIEANLPMPILPPPELDEAAVRIGQYVAQLIEDGATLQMGIGRIPDAVLRALTKHKDLGIHTEMFSDGVIDLFRNGVINNVRKTFHPGKMIASFCMGTQRLYDFVHENPHVEFHPSEYVNNPAIISRNENMVAINSAIEVDLTGQVVSDSVGRRFYSGIGGQVDFIRGAAMSRGGRPIIALPSTAKNGTISKIVPFLTEGSGVVTSRGDVHYVVTEYGIATLRGKSVRERALELIQVAHPQFRDQLLTQVRTHHWVPDYQIAQPSRVEELGDPQEIRLRLKGNVFIMRPLHASDERIYQEFFYSHDDETVLQRYRYRPDGMSRHKASTMVNVNQSRDLALCIVRRKGPRETILAVGRYFWLESGNIGETSIVVQIGNRAKGMASTLLGTLIGIARKRGLEQLVCVVRVDNKPMRKLLEKYAFETHGADDPMDLKMVLPLTTLPESPITPE
ncbi:MAG: GNAT family N-acetyltransferase [Magnetococcales bacterium]|nr:GNAT family N-acetyltransferase [Magnetococcales bacterium]NGZ04928.1 GNAT family N-acetyltransferase [Magnetococcales bacterium]